MSKSREKREKIQGINKRLKALSRLREYSDSDRIEALEDRVGELEDRLMSAILRLSVLEAQQVPSTWDYGKVTCD